MLLTNHASGKSPPLRTKQESGTRCFRRLITDRTTNAAFAALPEGTVEGLLKPEKKEKLAAILTYHVVAGKVMAKDVAAGKVKTVQGTELTITPALRG